MIKSTTHPWFSFIASVVTTFNYIKLKKHITNCRKSLMKDNYDESEGNFWRFITLFHYCSKAGLIDDCFQWKSHFVLCIYLDGPETPTVTGPPRVKMGNSATLSCNASSNPPSSYTWFYNGSQVANTSEYVSPPLNRETNTFMCEAYNNITGEKSTTNITVTAIGEIWIMEHNNLLVNSTLYKSRLIGY